MTNLAGKVVFVAGASRGIGAAIATAVADAGAAVAVAARTEQAGRVRFHAQVQPDRLASQHDGALSAHGSQVQDVRPVDLPGFIAAELLGALIALALAAWLIAGDDAE